MKNIRTVDNLFRVVKIRAVGNRIVSLTDLRLVFGHSTIHDNTIKTPFTATNNVDNLEYTVRGQ